MGMPLDDEDDFIIFPEENIEQILTKEDRDRIIDSIVNSPMGRARAECGKKTNLDKGP
jgi:hypothetical protein